VPDIHEEARLFEKFGLGFGEEEKAGVFGHQIEQFV
jgi:hypothetical protein